MASTPRGSVIRELAAPPALLGMLSRVDLWKRHWASLFRDHQSTALMSAGESLEAVVGGCEGDEPSALSWCSPLGTRGILAPALGAALGSRSAMCVESAVGVRPGSMVGVRPVQPVLGPCAYSGDGSTGSSSQLDRSILPSTVEGWSGENMLRLPSRIGVDGMDSNRVLLDCFPRPCVRSLLSCGASGRVPCVVALGAGANMFTGSSRLDVEPLHSVFCCGQAATGVLVFAVEPLVAGSSIGSDRLSAGTAGRAGGAGGSCTEENEVCASTSLSGGASSGKLDTEPVAVLDMRFPVLLQGCGEDAVANEYTLLDSCESSELTDARCCCPKGGLRQASMALSSLSTSSPDVSLIDWAGLNVPGNDERHDSISLVNCCCALENAGVVLGTLLPSAGTGGSGVDIVDGVPAGFTWGAEGHWSTPGIPCSRAFHTLGLPVCGAYTCNVSLLFIPQTCTYALFSAFSAPAARWHPQVATRLAACTRVAALLAVERRIGHRARLSSLVSAQKVLCVC